MAGPGSPPLQGATAAAWGRGFSVAAADLALWVSPSAINDAAEAPWARSVPITDTGSAIAWDRFSIVTDETTAAAWGMPVGVDVPLDADWTRHTPWRETTDVASWDQRSPWRVSVDSTDWGMPVWVCKQAEGPWQKSTPKRERSQAAPWSGPVTLGRGGAAPWGRSFGWFVSVRDEAAYESDITQPGPPAVTPSGRAIKIVHTVTLTLTDGTPLPIVSASLSLNRSSVAWSGSIVFAQGSTTALVKPTPTAPVELVLTVDGYEWRLFAEQVSESRAHGSQGVRIACRGLTAELGAPYQAAGSLTTAAQYTGQQLIENELPFGWSLSSWNVDLAAIDWLVPAGGWSYTDQTPIAAIRSVAGAVGARVDPVRDTRAIVIAPRYPVMPWDWSTATPDRAIDTGSIIEVTTQWVGGASYNAIAVHGTTTAGVVGIVRRSGTAGDAPLSPVSHPLITTSQAVRERGRQEIAASSGPSVEVSVTIPLAPVGGDPELASVGELIEVADQTETWRGIVTGVVISVQRGSVKQTLTIERR